MNRIHMTDSNFAEQVIKYIVSCSTEELGDLTILNVAEKMGISQSHLYFIFQKEKKIPPGRFLMFIKMHRAAAILENNETLSVKRVAGKMGFSSTDYFIRVFKESFGTTPGKYRTYCLQSPKPDHSPESLRKTIKKAAPKTVKRRRPITKR